MAPERLAAALLVLALAAGPAAAEMAPPKSEAELDALAHAGRVREAIVALEQYVRAHPLHDPQRFLLARAYLENGQAEKATELYQWIVQRSAFPASREKAKVELAKLGELPTVPVNEPVAPPARVGRGPGEGFAAEESTWALETVAGGGWDSNANSATGYDFDRLFFFDRLRAHQDSESWYGRLGASALGAYALNDRWSWRTAAGAAARENFNAHFADTQDVSLQTGLRWSGEQQRLFLGLAYGKTWFGQEHLDHVYALTAGLEVLTRGLSLGVQGEAARLRSPGAPLQDVDSFVIRVEASPVPDAQTRWRPGLVVYSGFEEETHDESPFGRNLWGLSGSLARRFGHGFTAEGTLTYAKSMFDAAFTGVERRSDDRKEASLVVRYKPDEDSRWSHALGASYARTDSSEPTFDFERLLATYEISAAWGPGR